MLVKHNHHCLDLLRRLASYLVCLEWADGLSGGCPQTALHQTVSDTVSPVEDGQDDPPCFYSHKSMECMRLRDTDVCIKLRNCLEGVQ